MSASPFDPNSPASSDSGVFGLPFTLKDSSLVFYPVPWEATVSYGTGTSKGPAAILEASHQVDLYDFDVVKPYEAGLFWRNADPEVLRWNREARLAAMTVFKGSCDPKKRSVANALARVNGISERLNQKVFSVTRSLITQGKTVGIVGGEHSVPFGAILAVAATEKDFGILHFDAHSDTRRAYEGFTWSHASIMYNVLEKVPAVSRLVQVGIRDFCEEEYEYTQKQNTRTKVFYDSELARKAFEGVRWADQCKEIISTLPKAVWLSFDIDGLDPKLCPTTGTPVPGGLSFQQANYLLRTLVESGRRIIGFDLSEVAPSKGSDWDANVGARVLYKLAAWTLASQGKAKIR